MKPFDLEEYLKKPHLNIVTKSGLPVRIVCTDRMATSVHPILALVKINDDNEIVTEYTEEGKYYRKEDSDYDLFFTSEKKEGWINIYKNNFMNGIYSTENEALQKILKEWQYIVTIKIEWEE